jgi:hypothetical protein
VSRDSVVAGARKFAALRRLDLVDARTAHDMGRVEQLSSGESSELLVMLASKGGLVDSAEVDRLLDALLRELGDPPMDDQRAGRFIAQLLAERIIGGSIEPAVGARQIWWDVAEKVPALEPRLRIFVGLASKWEDSVHHRHKYEDDIVAAAMDLLSEEPDPGE